MKIRVLLLAVFLVVLSSAAAQTMFRDLRFREGCQSALAKLERFDDFTVSVNSRSCAPSTRAAEFTLAGDFDYLFGQRDVLALFWFERPSRSLQQIVFMVQGIEGLDFIEAAIEGFTAERGEPEFRLSVDPYDMVSHGSERTETVARWPGENGIVVEVEAYANPAWGMFSGRVRVKYEKPLTLTTPAQDAGQF